MQNELTMGHVIATLHEFSNFLNAKDCLLLSTDLPKEDLIDAFKDFMIKGYKLDVSVFEKETMRFMNLIHMSKI